MSPGDTTVWSPPADTLAAPRVAPRTTATGPWLPAMDRLGLENLASDTDSLDRTRVIFEDRRYRHPAQALGRVWGAAPGLGLAPPTGAVLRRRGIAAAYLEPDSLGHMRRLTYPSDTGFPTLPEGPFARPTHRSIDFIVGVEYRYELGQIDRPFQYSLDMRWEAAYDPWPGAHVRASWLTPVHNDFLPDPIHPDAGKPRPGPNLIEQYLWLGRVGLSSGTFGIMGDDRWGGSLGLARPFAGGIVLFDAQADLTGAFAWSDSGAVYSPANRFDGYAGIAVRPPMLPGLTLRARGARYLREDQGFEAELERRFGDVKLAFQGLRSSGFNSLGVRLTVPVPPMLRPTHWPVRVLPIPTFTLSYRTEATPIGQFPSNLASREDFLDGTWRPELAGESDRFRADRDGTRLRRPAPRLEPVSFSGMTGFITVPSASVLPDGQVELGYSRLPLAAAWDHRGEYANEVWYGAVGLLPRLEVGIRWTVIPGLRAFDEFLPGTPLVDADRMLSGRLSVFTPRGWRPGLALGAEDVYGTRRFHSSYIVSGIEPRIFGLRARASAGYAPRVFDAYRYTLDGFIGAVEVSDGRWLTPSVEYDSRRWNAGLGVHVGPYVQLRVAWFEMKYAALGGGISLTL